MRGTEDRYRTPARRVKFKSLIDIPKTLLVIPFPPNIIGAKTFSKVPAYQAIFVALYDY